MLKIKNEASAVEIIDSLVATAVKMRASDIHLETIDSGLKVRFRIDGMLQELVRFPPDLQNALLSRIKIMADLDIAQKRIPQDGRLAIRNMENLDIRVSTLPTIYGEKIVLRILDKNAQNLSLEELQFSTDNFRKLRNFCNCAHGMILATGPTGSGKTTTLHAILSELNDESINAVTIEDPVEYRLSGVNQIQVNNKAGLTFAGGLRAILRQDPNIIMVGEIRDRETAEIAIRSALTGHLVLSSLHTTDAVGALPRLLDMGVERFLVCSAVLGVIAQRLVRRICPKCKSAYKLTKDSPEDLFLRTNGFDTTTEFVLYRGLGCEHCHNTGYTGRMSVQEVLCITPEIRGALMQGMAGQDIELIACQQGFANMRTDGIYKALSGATTLSEVIRIAYGL